MQRLDLYALSVASELARHEQVPALFELDDQITAVLRKTVTEADRERAGRRLAKMNVKVGTQALLLIDVGGRVVAASDWYLRDSLMGDDLSSSPIFVDALRSGEAGNFRANQQTGAPEYYFSRLLRKGGAVLGVAVARISLEPLQAAWVEAASRSNSDQVVVVDENDVVVLSSVPNWSYRSVAPASQAALFDPQIRGKYLDGAEELIPLNLTDGQELPHGAMLVNLKATGFSGSYKRAAAHFKALPRPPWRVVTLSDVADIERSARDTAFAAGSLAACLGVLCIYWLRRRRDMLDRLAAREALQKAHDELGMRVEERTRELSKANTELLREVSERQRAEETLRQTTDQLVQAGKMALLGQMSAGITHEINQPLTALRALSDNARLFLGRGRLEDVSKNLHSITELIERIASITSQLKTFGRKAQGRREIVFVRRAVLNALLLLENRITLGGVEVRVDVPEDLKTWCDSNRLEQVLVNLFANSIDALTGLGTKKILAVTATSSHGRVHVRVADSGPGIPPHMRTKLFEPFFTTKPVGEGLGLGLVISASIIAEYGGTLRALDTNIGAAFEFDLEQAD